MLAPHELKNKDFSKSLRGYSTVEVDEHIDFIIEKYTELYRENDELEKKLRLTEAQLDAMKGEEESIRAALINAQKASTRIINEANERADVIMRSAKNTCDRLVAELKANVKKENERLKEAQREVEAFKASLFEGYKSHIELIESITPEAPVQKLSDDELAEQYSELVIERIKKNLSGQSGVISGSDVPFAEDDGSADFDASEEANPSAEAPIPDQLEDYDIDTEAQTVRDASEFPENVTEITPEANEASSNRSGIIDSIKKLNKSVNGTEDDDEEFLNMLNSVSKTDGKKENTSEFEMVYDRKK